MSMSDETARLEQAAAEAAWHDALDVLALDPTATAQEQAARARVEAVAVARLRVKLEHIASRRLAALRGEGA